MAAAMLELFAACQPGLESLLARELAALGHEPEPTGGGVACRGSLGDAMRMGLWLGTASHVLVRVAHFPCRALGELERKAAALPWGDWLLPHVPLAVHATARQSRLYHTGAIAERVASAVGAALGTAPRVAGPEDAAAVLHVRFHADRCTLSIDGARTPLHRRGYRLDARKAPLREDLAHALLLAADLGPGDAVLDPFCGSGTIAIEAAGLLLGLPPGRLRPPPFAAYSKFDRALWAQVAAWSPRTAPVQILASDRDAGAVAAVVANAARAGVAPAITCVQASLGAQPWLGKGGAPARGVVATNPPFGRRVPGQGGLLPLYQMLGHRVAGLGEGWRIALLAHDVRLARRSGLPLAAAFTTRHGGLAVTALVGSAQRAARAASG